MTRYSFAIIGFFILTANVDALPPLPTRTDVKPSPSDYRGVDEAVKSTIKEASPGSFGATGYLGITVKRDKDGKPLVDVVQPSSPAQAAGIKVGDVVATVDSQVVATPESFRERIQAYPADGPVKLGLVREGKTLEVTAKLTATSRPFRLGSGTRPFSGLVLGQAKDGDEVKVTTVLSGSPAEEAKIKVGDVVLKLENNDVNRPTVLRDLMQEKRPGDEISLVLQREGKEVPVKVKLAVERGEGGGRFGGGGAIGLWKKDVMKVAIVGIEFSDIKHNAKVSLADFEKHFVGSGTSTTLNDYLREVSANKFRLEGKAVGWIEVAKKRSEYVQGSGVSNKTAVMRDAMDKLLAKDKDAVKGTDALIFVYAGEEVRGNAGSVYFPHAGIYDPQSRRQPYVFLPEGGAQLAAVNAYVKPTCQLLGLPDLASRRENIGSEGLGPWCALSDATTGGKRLHLSPWAKEKLGWLTPTIIDPSEKQKLILAPIEGSQRECFKVLIRPDGSEYLLLENRKKKGFDVELPGEGLLIWRVVNDRPVLEESHGVTGPTGPASHLASVPYPSPANNAFTPNTIPSSRSPLGGGLPVHITNIKRQPDGRVSFQIGREYE